MTTGKTVNLQGPPANEVKADEPEAMGKTATHRKAEVRLGREIQARIGQQLRGMYDEVVNQGVPKHIDDLVRRLTDQDDGVA
jgi:hypothetical protein